MPGLGTIVNALAIVAGGIIGLFASGGLKKRYQEIITQAMALSVMFMALAGVMAKMLVPDGDSFSTRGTFTLIFSLAIGAFVGEMINIDLRLDRFGEWLKKKSGNEKEAAFVNAFVTASLTVCIGAMAIIGSINDGIYADHSVLFTKAIMDFVIIIVMTASLGKGCIFSAIPVALFQGSITLLARLIEPLLTEAALGSISLVGSVLIFCIGINLLADGRFRIRVGNMLPSLIVAVVCSYLGVN